MAYRASLGGIDGSGVRMPNTQPIIDIGSVIDSASRAFANNREGVLHRALLQQAANRADRDDAMKEEAHRMALISAGFRPAAPGDETQPAEQQAPGAQPSSPAMNPNGPDAIPSGPAPAAQAGPPPIRLGGKGPNADLVYGGTDLKTQRQMALRKNALQAAQAAHPGMFSNEEIELATHDDHAYDALVARREGILKGDQDARDRETSLQGAVGPDGKPLSASTIKMLARSLPAYNKYLDTQVNPPKDPIQIHASERDYDIKHPTEPKWTVEATTNGLVQVNPETGEVRPLTDAAGKPLQRPVTAQGGAQQEKAKIQIDLMGQALPTMEALAGKVRPAAITLALRHPTVGNAALNQDEQTYVEAARNYLAGVLHAESGARLTDTQIAFGQQRYLPNLEDTPETISTKTKAARATYEDRVREYSGGQSGTPAPATDNPFSALIPKKKKK